ncbi:MAG: hypothetical protein E8D45_02180 [Nitrospira sp.]|nr:MAG: hypothetical protein E8D45_02180 [Nitrospira sp.]
MSRIRLTTWNRFSPARVVLFVVLGALGARSTCISATTTPTDLVSKGREIFFNETFKGNGRTCGTCHPAENNFTIGHGIRRIGVSDGQVHRGDNHVGGPYPTAATKSDRGAF